MLETFRPLHLAGQFCRGQPLTNNLRYHQREAIRVSERIVFGRTVIVAEHLLLAVQVERLDGNVTAGQTALKQ